MINELKSRLATARITQDTRSVVKYFVKLVAVSVCGRVRQEPGTVSGFSALFHQLLHYQFVSPSPS